MTPHVHCPQTTEDLVALIARETEANGFGCSLNHIDVSQITSMNSLFSYSDFDGDIAEWDVSNVTNADSMFYAAKFNGDISRWRLPAHAITQDMFVGSAFRGDLRQWPFPAYLGSDNPAPMFGWSSSHRHRDGPWEPLRIPVWPVTFQVLFGYEELTSLDAANEWLAAQPLCRYHWDVLLYEQGRPSRSDASWRQPGQMEHLRALLPTLQGLGMPPLEMAEQLHARWQTRGREHATLPLPTLE